MNDIVSNWEACMRCVLIEERTFVPWFAPLVGTLKFNMDGASRGKPGPAGARRVLCNSNGEVLLIYLEECGCL